MNVNATTIDSFSLKTRALSRHPAREHLRGSLVLGEAKRVEEAKRCHVTNEAWHGSSLHSRARRLRGRHEGVGTTVYRTNNPYGRSER